MRSNYNIITMKKLVYLLAVGSLAFTACNNSPAYKVSGTVEGLADGDTIYLQEYKNGDWVKLDSTTVAGGTFTFTGRQDTATNCFIIYAKDGKRNRADFFLENGNIKNSVNFPNCDMGTCVAVGRIAITHKNIPNMISQLTKILGAEGLNIADMTNKSKGEYAYTLIDLESAASREALDELKAIEGVSRVRVVK